MPPGPLAPQLAPAAENRLAEPADPDLAGVVQAWPQLPEHIKAAVVALIKSAGQFS
jgi:hypothetical protein